MIICALRLPRLWAVTRSHASLDGNRHPGQCGKCRTPSCAAWRLHPSIIGFTKIRVSKWPNKGDLPVDRARQVCAEYRRALAEVAPDAANLIDRAAIAAGETWVNPGLAIHD